MDNDRFVEELANKYAMDMSMYHDDNDYALDATPYVAVEGVRKAIREAMAQAYRDAAMIALGRGLAIENKAKEIGYELVSKAEGMTDGQR
jgi:hypothetical protein